MKSILKFLYLLLTAILLFAYSLGISEKIKSPTFKNLPSSDYVWLGILLILLIYINIKWLYTDIRKKNRKSRALTKQNSERSQIQNIKQYDVFVLAKDLNPKITAGMRGVILEIWEQNNFEVEFVNENGTNYEFDGQRTFAIDKSFIGDAISI